MNPFIETITSDRPAVRNRSFRRLCSQMPPSELLAACNALDLFRRKSDNLYDRVRACLFLYAAHRFSLSQSSEFFSSGIIPYDGFAHLLERRFEQAIASFQAQAHATGPSAALFSALAEAYHHLAFQTLLDQVRRSVRASQGNRWMFRVGHPQDHPVRIRPEMLERKEGALYPVLTEFTPVRLDLSHSGWSDIFFLGMDYPEGARVLNISVDLGVYGRDAGVAPPIETYVRVIPEPLLRLTSIDLDVTKDITELRDLFNFGNDYLSLLKAGIIASGLIPSSFEGTGHAVSEILGRVVGSGMGLELVTKVNDIPKGSRLAVSTNLLASIVSVLMRATGQTAQLEGTLCENERRLIASRAILGEWLGGSGGGWQDSGGIWPAFKIIQGAPATSGDPEYGISKGCLLPRHHLLGGEELADGVREAFSESLVLLHGGMAQNVGPILEMVTEKYLLREEAEWQARLDMRGIFDGILRGLREGDIAEVARNTTRNWEGPLKTIIPYVTNQFTETIIRRSRETLGNDFWGFLMLGGMSGGGMAMFVAPKRAPGFRDEILDIMRTAKRTLEDALPFAMDPVVYNFAVNDSGSVARCLTGGKAVLPFRYYALQIPELVRRASPETAYQRRMEMEHVTAHCLDSGESRLLLRTTVSHLFQVSDSTTSAERLRWDGESERIKGENGFDRLQHEQIRGDLRAGRIGLSRNRLPVDTLIEDVSDSEIFLPDGSAAARSLGAQALREGRVAVFTLAAGVGSRWTTGAGVIKALNPFIQMGGRHRSFLETHVNKTRRTAERYGAAPPHIVSTSFLTHAPIVKHLGLNDHYGYADSLSLSPGRAIGQRLIPMVRDLIFLWEEMPQETLDEQKQKVREAVRAALIDWARAKGEGVDYTDNVPIQRFSPPGHWYEIPNLLRNGTLARLIAAHPRLETIMLHNIDTLGADLDAETLGLHLGSGNTLTFEVVPRRIEDRGGGLARVNGRIRLLEGLAQPREEDELSLRYYNTMTTWIQIDPLLHLFGLSRKDLNGPEEQITEAIRNMGQRMPTYVTIKDVKWRWGHGQEDVYPVAQFEKLWSDMSALPDCSCGYVAVPRLRGQQLKDPNQLDAWANDGSREYISRLAGFS